MATQEQQSKKISSLNNPLSENLTGKLVHLPVLGLKNVLIVMALKEESQGIFETHGFSVFYSGMGLIQSTLKLTQELQKRKLAGEEFLPQWILNLGTCGTFNHDLLHQIVHVTSVSSRGDFIQPLRKYINLNESLSNSQMSNVENKNTLNQNFSSQFKTQIHCASADFVSVEENFFKTNSDLKKYETQLVFDMELLALTQVANEFNIPIVSLKYVTDISGQSSFSQWKSALKKSAEKLLMCISDQLHKENV